MTNQYAPSPAMLAALAAPKKKFGAEMKYGWLDIEQGKSITIPDNDIKLASLETLAYRTGKRHNRRFKVLHHPEQKLYEIYRIE